MKCVLFLALLSVGLAMGLVGGPPPPPPPPGFGQAAVALATPAPPPTLAKDLKRLKKLIPLRPVGQLIRRYLLNDPQFQTFVRIINSYDAFALRMYVLTQPEVLAFQTWVRTQLMLSGGSFEMESDEVFSIFNPTPFWANSVAGWQGFMMELQTYLPPEYVQYYFQSQAQQGGIFAQFWTRLQALKPVYERVLTAPATARLVAQLEAGGITTVDLDNYIRSLFGWHNPATPAPANGIGVETAVVHPGPPAPQVGA